MHRKGIFFMICLFSLFAMSCRSNRQLIQATSSDSVKIEVRDVQKTIQIAADSVSATMQIVPSTGSGNTPPVFTPQQQVIETERTSVRVELTATGKIKATAISKPIAAKVTVQERTITKTSAKTEVYVQKPSAVGSAVKSVTRTINTVVYTGLLLAAVYALLRWRNGIATFFKKLLKLK